MATAEVPVTQEQESSPAPAVEPTTTADPNTIPRILPDQVLIPVHEPAEPVQKPAETNEQLAETEKPTEPTKELFDPAEPINKVADEKAKAAGPLPAENVEETDKPAEAALVGDKAGQAAPEEKPAGTAAENFAEASAVEKKNLSNLCFILNKPQDVTFAERPIPKISSPYDVVVAVNYTGICGSDVHYWLHGAIGHFVVKSPMVLGHESAGTVVEVGSSVKTLQPGDRVALEPGYPCRRCRDCFAGRYNICHDMVFAATPPYDGTLAGFWLAPFDFCYKLPANVSLQEGALIEPLAVAVHIVKQGRVRPGHSIVVMGAGPVGLLCAAVARSFGATKVVSVDIVRSKIEFAKELAATHTYLSQRLPAAENAKGIIDSCDLGEGADVVIDASGAETSIQTCLHVVKTGGTYVQGGMGKADVIFPIMSLCLKEVTTRGSFRYGSGDYRLAIELVASGKVDVKKLITGVVGFRHAEDAFKKVREGEAIKILIAGPNEKIEDEMDTAVDPKVAAENEPVGTDDEDGCC